jgi:hypothetical protein
VLDLREIEAEVIGNLARLNSIFVKSIAALLMQL